MVCPASVAEGQLIVPETEKNDELKQSMVFMSCVTTYTLMLFLVRVIKKCYQCCI